MSRKIIPVQDADAAAALAEAIFAATCPGRIIPADNVTRYAFGWITHPTTGAVAIDLDDADAVRIDGQNVPTINLVPNKATAGAMSYDEAAAAGWFAAP